jgi:hypothetical protein
VREHVVRLPQPVDPVRELVAAVAEQLVAVVPVGAGEELGGVVDAELAVEPEKLHIDQPLQRPLVVVAHPRAPV